MSDTAVITFGRFNPITIGHEKLVETVLHFAIEIGADPFIYLSHSQNKTNNPLPYDVKLKLARKAFPDIDIVESSAPTIMQAASELYTNGWRKLVVFVGSDRVDEFNTLLNKYNGIEYNFDKIYVLSAGQRDAKLDTVEGMSGTKMRGYAINNDVEKFASGLPTNLKSDAEYIMNTIRKGLKYEN